MHGSPVPANPPKQGPSPPLLLYHHPLFDPPFPPPPPPTLQRRQARRSTRDIRVTTYDCVAQIRVTICECAFFPAFLPAGYQTDHAPESLRSPNTFSPGRYRFATQPTNQEVDLASHHARERPEKIGMPEKKKKKRAPATGEGGGYMYDVSERSGLHVDAEAISPRIACYGSLFFLCEHPALSTSWGNVFWLRGAGVLPCLPFSSRPPAHTCVLQYKPPVYVYGPVRFGANDWESRRKWRENKKSIRGDQAFFLLYRAWRWLSVR